MICAACSQDIWTSNEVDISCLDDQGDGELEVLHARCAYELGLPVCAYCGTYWEEQSDVCDGCYRDLMYDARLARAGL